MSLLNRVKGVQNPAATQGAKAPSNPSFDASNVNDQLGAITNQNSISMRQASAAGDRAAASRGLQNSSIGIESAQNAVVSAALPMAQQQAGFHQDMDKMSSQFDHDMDKLGIQNQHDMDKLTSEVQANTIGKFLDTQQSIMNDFNAQVATIYNNSNMSTADKEKAIKNMTASRDSQLKLISTIFDKLPTLESDWADFPSLGVPNVG